MVSDRARADARASCRWERLVPRLGLGTGLGVCGHG